MPEIGVGFGENENYKFNHSDSGVDKKLGAGAASSCSCRKNNLLHFERVRLEGDSLRRVCAVWGSFFGGGAL